MIDLTGKVAIVGGSASGIGEASARLMASLGAKVVVADIAIDAAKAVAAEINVGGGSAIALPFDLHDEVGIRKMIEDSVAHFGRLDILHANAADLSMDLMMGDQQIGNMEAATWERAYHANSTGTMLCSKYALPHIIAAGGGSIILTGSPTAWRGRLSNSAYSASKASLDQLVRLIAAQYGKQGVRANSVLPGLVLTEGVRRGMPGWAIQSQLDETLTPELCQPIDVANLVAFLASDAARMITGQSLFVDGGEASHVPAIGTYRAAAG